MYSCFSRFFRIAKNLFFSQYFRRVYFEYVCFRVRNFFSSTKNDYEFLDAHQTLNYLLTKQKSFIRFGDGEFAILYGFDIYFQKFHPVLKNKLLEILEKYTPDSPYLLGIPPIPVESLDYSDLSKQKDLSQWKKAEAFLEKRLNKNCIYGDPFMFRRFGYKGEKNVFKLWRNKSVILVGSMTQYFKDKQLEGTKNKHLVNCPFINAFEEYKRIMRDILKIIIDNHLKEKELVILVSLGPTAKIITYELSKIGLLTYDVGHYFDVIFKKI